MFSSPVEDHNTVHPFDPVSRFGIPMLPWSLEGSAAKLYVHQSVDRSHLQASAFCIPEKNIVHQGIANVANCWLGLGHSRGDTKNTIGYFWLSISISDMEQLYATSSVNPAGHVRNNIEESLVGAMYVMNAWHISLCIDASTHQRMYALFVQFMSWFGSIYLFRL